jgi:Uma2 family endonuclease
MVDPQRTGDGPFTASQIRPRDRYELSHGHAIFCAPTGGDGARATIAGSLVIDTDPGVDSTGIDAGFTNGSGSLRAPDIAVGVPDAPGWVRGAPPLAIEYASSGQDEDALKLKIADLLSQGTQQIWVVRLNGPRYVEVHTPNAPTKILAGNDELNAPGILTRPIPVELLYNRELAQQRALENLLKRFGYESIDAIRDEAIEEGREEGQTGARRETLIRILERRFGRLSDDRRMTLMSTAPADLEAAIDRAIDASSLEGFFAP